MSELTAYVAGAVVALWGVAHVVPTRAVVAGFEPTAIDNHRVILQEWIIEAVAMWGLAGLVFAVTVVGGDQTLVDTVYRVVAAILAVMAVVTAATGARTRVVWFKICPLLLASTAILLVVASLV